MNELTTVPITVYKEYEPQCWMHSAFDYFVLCDAIEYGEMAESVDALVSNASVIDGVGVQVPLSLPN